MFCRSYARSLKKFSPKINLSAPFLMDFLMYLTLNNAATKIKKKSGHFQDKVRISTHIWIKAFVPHGNPIIKLYTLNFTCITT